MSQLIKIGIECENLEDSKSRWGVGRLTLGLLEAYAANPELQKKYKLFLYFKKIIPDDEVFKNPIFTKRILGFPSFNIFYHILMPLRAMADNLDWMFFPAYMLPPLYLGRSVVMLTDDVYMEYKYGTLPFRYRLAYGLFSNWAAARAKKILAISETSKKEVARLYKIKPEKIFVSYLGVNLPQIKPLIVKDNYLLYVGQMLPRRHAKETILAFKEIATEFPELKLVMIGKDKYKIPVIEKLIREINQELGGERILNYEYIEKKEELERLYAEARALIYVSDREAFGLPPIEALSFGVAPVIMDNELGHEIFGEYALFSKTSAPEDIAQAIRQALTQEDKIEKIKNSGPDFVRKYNWSDFANKFFENLET